MIEFAPRSGDHRVAAADAGASLSRGGARPVGLEHGQTIEARVKGRRVERIRGTGRGWTGDPRSETLAAQRAAETASDARVVTAGHRDRPGKRKVTLSRPGAGQPRDSGGKKNNGRGVMDEGGKKLSLTSYGASSARRRPRGDPHLRHGVGRRGKKRAITSPRASSSPRRF